MIPFVKTQAKTKRWKLWEVTLAELTNALLANVSDVPEDLNVATAAVDPFTGNVVLHIESETFPIVHPSEQGYVVKIQRVLR